MDYVISRSQMRDLFLEGLIQFNYEDLLEKHYKRWIKIGDTVVDIGAHNGRHTEKFRDLVGENGAVLAFEPIPEKFKSLEKKFYNTRVSLVNSALSDQSGTAEFIVAEGSLEESGLKQRSYNNPDKVQPKKIVVSLKCLDEFENTIKGLSFVKIDIEGAEINCLRGAIKVIERFRPLVSVEYGVSSYAAYGNTKWSLFDFCKDHDYVLYDIFLNRLNTRKKWDAAVDSVCWDYFMVPSEKESLFIENVIQIRGGDGLPFPLVLEQALSKNPQNSVVLLQGFSSQEDWGVWTDGKEAIAKIEFSESPENDLILHIRAHGFVPVRDHSLKISIFAGDLNLGDINFTSQNEMSSEYGFCFTIPLEAVHDKSADIKFVISDPRSPADFGLTSDSRKLGMGLRNIAIYERIVSAP